MKFSEFAQSSDEELVVRLGEMRESYLKMRFQHATGQLDSPVKLRNIRRDIAKALTAQSQRRKLAATGGGEAAKGDKAADGKENA
ncbi:MAG: 50S ribosomal protein L29 [Nitrospinota bacterium]|nr:50S ribosomal protein L29 [Nitrospinota bacterium]MDH5678074.1 50S ribosomal protein L29 [Nitrospinota bacterium]MDH5755554.1 50S ribosomal protein L29 [Nitrospinota bacterium]